MNADIVEKKKPQHRACRYGHGCRRKDTCKFFHPPHTTASTTSNTDSNVCRHGLNCWSKNCRRTHPAGWNPRKKKPNASKPKDSPANAPSKTPHNQLEKGFYRGALRPADAKGYRAAGVLLLRRRPPSDSSYYQAKSTTTTTTGSGIQILLCAELRGKKKGGKKTGGLELNLLGGKIEEGDQEDSRNTAAREFWEETGRIASLNECQRIVGVGQDQGTACDQPIWCGPGKYVLYVASDAGSQWDALPRQYHELVQSGNKPPGAEPDYLVWVDWDLIRDSKGRSKDMEISFAVPGTSDSTEPSSSLSLAFSFFTLSIICNSVVKQGLESVIDTVATKRPQQAESLQGTTDGDLNLQDLSTSLKEMHVGVVS